MSIGSWVKRGIAAVGTGGLSELGGVRTLKDVGAIPKSATDVLGLTKPDANVQGQAETADEIEKRRAEFASNLQNYQNRNAPKQDTVQLGNAAQTVAPEHVFAQTAQGPNDIHATEATASKVAPTTVGPVSTYRAANIAPAYVANASMADGGGANQYRQNAALDTLQAAADGTAPSAAQAALRETTAKNIASQFALMSAARGSSVGRAQRAAADNTAKINQEAIGQAAELTANEQAAARGQLGQAVQGARGQDIGVSTTNAGLNTDVSKLNATQINQIAEDQARLEQQSRSEGAAATNTNTLEQGRITAGENSQDANLTTDVSKLNANNATDVTKFLSGLQQNNSQFNATAGNDISKFNVDGSTKVGLANTGATNQRTSEQGQIAYNTDRNNILSQIDMSKMDDAQKQALMSFILGSQGQSVTADKAISDTMIGQSKAQADALHDTIGGIEGIVMPKPGK